MQNFGAAAGALQGENDGLLGTSSTRSSSSSQQQQQQRSVQDILSAAVAVAAGAGQPATNDLTSSLFLQQLQAAAPLAGASSTSRLNPLLLQQLQAAAAGPAAGSSLLGNNNGANHDNALQAASLVGLLKQHQEQQQQQQQDHVSRLLLQQRQVDELWALRQQQQLAAALGGAGNAATLAAARLLQGGIGEHGAAAAAAAMGMTSTSDGLTGASLSSTLGLSGAAGGTSRSSERGSSQVIEDEPDDDEGENGDDDDDDAPGSDTFPFKLYRMIMQAEEDGKENIVSFVPDGQAFTINKPREFVAEIIPKFFTTTRMSSFQRQLNLYGFRRISEGRHKGGYFHKFFIKGRKSLCRKIKRKKTAVKAPPNFLLGGSPGFVAGPGSLQQNPNVSASVRHLLAQNALGDSSLFNSSLLGLQQAAANAASAPFGGLFDGGGVGNLPSSLVGAAQGPGPTAAPGGLGDMNEALVAALLTQQQRQQQQQSSDLVRQFLLQQHLQQQQQQHLQESKNVTGAGEIDASEFSGGGKRLG